MNDPIVCDDCGRTYRYDYVLAKLRETIPSERVRRPACDYCQHARAILPSCQSLSHRATIEA